MSQVKVSYLDVEFLGVLSVMEHSSVGKSCCDWWGDSAVEEAIYLAGLVEGNSYPPS